MSPIPDNVEDPDLYASIKEEIHEELDEEGKNWGVYASMMLVNRYKEAGGTYSDDEEYHRRKQLRKQQKKLQKNQQQLTGVNRWFAEKWINICESRPPNHLVQCGSSQKGYPVCRPYRRVSKETPMTYEEMDKSAIDKICHQKSKNPLQYIRFKSSSK